MPAANNEKSNIMQYFPMRIKFGTTYSSVGEGFCLPAIVCAILAKTIANYTDTNIMLISDMCITPPYK